MTRRVAWCALVIGGTAIAVSGGTAGAQIYPVPNQPLRRFSDPLERSPRLVGMGRLTLVIPDPHNRITLWDFAGNTAGLALDDSASALFIRPGTLAASSVHDFSDLLGAGERQDLAGRGTNLEFEAWHRNPGRSVFGAIGEVGQLRTDLPYSEEVEQRSYTSHPNVMAVLGGRMPFIWSPRLHAALRMISGFNRVVDEFRLVTHNAAGEYIDRDGTLGAPPNLFTPDEVDVETFGGGASIAYTFGPVLTASISADALRHKFSGLNDADRYVSEREETRPVSVQQATLVGRIGAFEWGADGRTWSSNSTETWVFSVSTNSGGAGAAPFAGRGDYQSRDEEGSLARARARWTSGPLELGASFRNGDRRVTLTPPPASDANSFNTFLNQIFYRDRGDTTIYPDSVVFDERKEKLWEAGGGASWRIRRGIIGAEYHQFEEELETTLSGRKEGSDAVPWTYAATGPRRAVWDVRGGLEYGLHPALLGRAGYIHRFEDVDDLTEQSEYVANTATLGLGVTPEGAHWRIEASFALEWWQADYGTPDKPRGTRHQVVAEIGWAF